MRVDDTYSAIRAGPLSVAHQHVRPGRRTVYGDGQAGVRVARALAELPLNSALTRKVITY